MDVFRFDAKRLRGIQMRKLVFTAVLGLSVLSIRVQDASALCYYVAHWIHPTHISGPITCYKDNWLFGSALDWTAN